MRKIATLCALMLALLVVAAPFALAGGESHAEKGKTRAAEAKAMRHADAADANETSDDARKADKAEKAETRRSLAESFRAKLQQWRDAWKENATSIRAACHAVEPDQANSTKEEHKAWAHCIRDGYKQFFQALKLERKAWKAEAAQE